MLPRRRRARIETERLTLRPPQHSDFREWASLRQSSSAFLVPWEPAWASDHLSRKGFTNRVYWASRAIASGTGVPMFMIRREDARLVGAITLDNIRRGPAQDGTLGYWVGEPFARQGYMREAIQGIVHYAFDSLDLSRIQAACLPENRASRGVLERTGFKYEGVAQSYLQINGRWRTHVLYANLRSDRRGKTDVRYALPGLSFRHRKRVRQSVVDKFALELSGPLVGWTRLGLLSRDDILGQVVTKGDSPVCYRKDDGHRDSHNS